MCYITPLIPYLRRQGMAYLPVALNLENRKIVIIGGGKIALQKVRTLLKYDATIELYAREISPEIDKLGISCKIGEYEKSQLIGASIVYGATDSWELNHQISLDARAAGAFVNVIDDPKNCDFVSPAIEQRGDISIAVTSNGKSVKESIATRNQIRELLND